MTDTILAALTFLVDTPPAFAGLLLLVLFWGMSAVKDKATRIWGQHMTILGVLGSMVWWAAEQSAETILECIQ